jgi:glycosyltransferase 2 family protein
MCRHETRETEPLYESAKRRMSLALRAAVAIGLLLMIVWQAGGLGAIGTQLGRIDPVYAILIIGLFTVDRALMTYKWLRLLSARGQSLTFFRGMKLYTSSMFWGMFLPTTLGPDAIRAASAIRLGLDGDQVLASITIERMIGFLSAMVLGLLGMVHMSSVAQLDDRYDVLWKAGDLTLLLALLAFMASFSNRVFEFIHNRLFRRWHGNRIIARLRKFHQTYMGYQDVKGTLLVFLGLTLVEQLLPILESAWLAWGMGIDVGMAQIAGAVILTRLLSRVPISIDALGVYEGIFVLLMAAVGVGATEAVAMAVAGRILQTISWLPWWTAHVLESGNLRRPRPLVKES